MVLCPGLPSFIDVGGPMPFVPALVLSLIISAALGWGLYLVIFRPLCAAPPLAPAVASLGVLVVIQSLIVERLGTRAVNVNAIFPRERWEIGGVAISQERFWC